jgi:tRNA pseudouridine38-40 synthase
MMIKIAYSGEKFHGIARQPGLRTVEGEILHALATIGYTGKIYTASRTDKGVSALCNVIKVDIERTDVCRVLTGLLHDIWAYAYSSQDANPRYCTKQYIYFLPGYYAEDEIRTCCETFSGEHDFFSFAKGTTGNCVRTIHIDYTIHDSLVLFHFTGRSFLWEMIRRIMSAIKAYLTKTITLCDMVNMLERKNPDKQPPAPAENLLLANLVYPFPFTVDTFSLNQLYTHITKQHQFYTMKTAIFAEMLHSDLFKKRKNEN